MTSLLLTIVSLACLMIAALLIIATEQRRKAHRYRMPQGATIATCRCGAEFRNLYSAYAHTQAVHGVPEDQAPLTYHHGSEKP